MPAREAKLILENFCSQCVPIDKEKEAAMNEEINELAQIEAEKMDESISVKLSLNSGSGGGSSDSSVRNLPFKPNYVIKESIKNGVRYFLCVLYMP